MSAICGRCGSQQEDEEIYYKAGCFSSAGQDFFENDSFLCSECLCLYLNIYCGGCYVDTINKNHGISLKHTIYLNHKINLRTPKSNG